MNDSIKNYLKNLYQDKKFIEIVKDKGLANLGDNFANFVYSLAKSKVLKKASGWKVSGKTLANALKDSDLRKFCPSRASTHDLADYAETIIIYIWFTSEYSINQMVDVLSKDMINGTFDDIKKEERTASKAFTKLFLEFQSILKEKELIK